MARPTFRLQSKFLAAFALIIAIDLGAVITIQWFNGRIVDFAGHVENDLVIENDIHSYLQAVRQLSSGLYMMAAGQEGQGRSLAIEAELLLDELDQRFQDDSWRAHAVGLDDLERCLRLARELRDEFAIISALLAERQHAGQPTLPGALRGRAAMDYSLSRVGMLTGHAGLYTARIEEKLRQHADHTSRLGDRLIATSRLSILITAAASTLLAIMVSVLLARSLSRRLSILGRVAGQLGHGDLGQRAPPGPRDELGELALAFNRMAEELERKTELLLSKEYVENILRTMINGLFVLDGAGAIERVNRAACTLLGRAERDLLGRPLRNFVARPADLDDPAGTDAHVDADVDADADAVADLVADVVAGQARNREARLRDCHGRAVPVALSSAMMEDQENGPIRVVCVAADISERNELFARLVEAKSAAEEADRAKGAFLASMSHELRTPLNGIMGYAQLLLADPELDETHREAVEIMYRSGEHLLTLLNDILDISKIEAGRMELHLDEFDLPRFLDNIADMFRARASQKRIRFSCQLSPEVPPVVRGDDRRLRQVLINLLGNAIKFTDRGGVTFAVDSHRGGLRFRVEDTGIGIDPADLPTIFAPFQQVGTRRGDVEGTGLGLAITRRLLGMMGSELRVTSAPGRGSVFSFDLDLPAAASCDSHNRSGAARPPPVDEVPAPALHPGDAVPRPPIATLEALLELARRGDIQAIRARLADIRAADSAYEPFTAHLHTLAKQYQIKQIRQFLQPLLEADPTAGSDTP